MKFLHKIMLISFSLVLVTDQVSGFGIDRDLYNDYDDCVVAVVNDVAITKSEVYSRAIQAIRSSGEELSSAAIARRFPEERDRALMDIIVENLLYAESLAQELNIRPRAVQDRMSELIENIAGGDPIRFRQMLAAENLTMSEYEEMIRRDIAISYMMGHYVVRPARVSASDIRNFYEENLVSYFTIPLRYRLEITYINKADITTEEAKKWQQEIRDEVAAGNDFIEVCKKYDLRASKAFKFVEGTGSEFLLSGERAAGMDEMLADALEGLSEGEVSELISFDSAYAIARLVKRLPAEPQPLDANIRTQIERLLNSQRRSEKYNELVERLKRRHFVKILELVPSS